MSVCTGTLILCAQDLARVVCVHMNSSVVCVLRCLRPVCIDASVWSVYIGNPGWAVNIGTPGCAVHTCAHVISSCEVSCWASLDRQQRGGHLQCTPGWAVHTCAQVLSSCVRCPAGRHLTDSNVVDIFNACFRIGHYQTERSKDMSGGCPEAAPEAAPKLY